jgi:hypothetical protein
MAGVIQIAKNFDGTLPAADAGLSFKNIYDARDDHRYDTYQRKWESNATEQKTGEMWKNKPVYIRQFTGNIVATANTNSVVNLIAGGIDDLCQYGGSFQSGASASNYSVVGRCVDGAITTQGGVSVSAATRNLILHTNSTNARTGTTNNAYSVWAKYTKTTD